VNLSDGLDGLAAGLSGIASLTFGLFAYVIGRVDTSGYLGVFYLPGAGELTVFCAAVSGAAIGFLWFNAPPAQVFMGDTGSLALGGAIGAVAVLLKSEFLLVFVGGVFVLEGLSVLTQSGWFKYTRWRTGTGRRVFRMAPLHHHFEKLGWPETRIVIRFYILGIIFSLIGLATLKVR
jgi:phospho-N-acetylmuramoyl-pentapeptide-transferase